MAAFLTGVRTWSLSRDKDGERTYTIRHEVRTDDSRDGPYTVLQCVGLPEPGESWRFGNDLDEWATIQSDAKVSLHPGYKEGEDGVYWIVEQTATTKAPERSKCQDAPVGDPLQEPYKVSGSFTKHTEEATEDRFGNPIENSAHEQIRGQQVEFDRSLPSVKIDQNVPILELALVSAMMDTVNDAPLWGVPARCVKLSGFSWERKFYGRCYVYYTRTLEFSINIKDDPDTGLPVSGFDRTVLDEGTKVLRGRWDTDSTEWITTQVGGKDPDPANPADFIRYKDRNGENTRAILDGHGKPWQPDPITVTTCSQCNPAPKYWEVSGFEDFPGVENTKYNVTLQHESGCLWQGYANDDPLSGEFVYLEFAADTWTFSADGLGSTYTLDADSWQCAGENIMDQDTVGGNADPATITLTPISSTPPGRRHIEYYPESNFLLLDIPTDL